MTQGRRAPRRRQIGVVRRRQRTIVGEDSLVIEPLLDPQTIIKSEYMERDMRRSERTEGRAARDALFLRGDGFMPRGLYWDCAGIGGEVE